MTPGLVIGLAVAPALALVTAALAHLALHRLPEPDAEPGKIRYRDLGSARFLTGTALLAALTAILAWATLPATVLPVWWVLSSIGVLLVAIDARTTWLPLPLTRLAWLLMATALIAVGLLAGWPTAVRGLTGAVAAGGLYFIVWWLSRGGFGFGDVRFAPLLGAATASGSWTLLLWGLAMGSFVGGAQGLVRLVRRRRDGFAYAPAMFAGVYLAAVLLELGN